MSSELKPPTRRLSSSTIAGKTDNVDIVERSGETAEALTNDDYYIRFPNNWSKIRSAMR